MRANLTAPALATWLVVGTIVCSIWHSPWYIGVLTGLVAAAAAYRALVTLGPKLDAVPDWVGHAIASPFYVAFAYWLHTAGERFNGLVWMFGLLAALSALNALLAVRRRKQTAAPNT